MVCGLRTFTMDLSVPCDVENGIMRNAGRPCAITSKLEINDQYQTPNPNESCIVDWIYNPRGEPHQVHRVVRCGYFNITGVCLS